MKEQDIIEILMKSKLSTHNINDDKYMSYESAERIAKAIKENYERTTLQPDN
jgi:hypothetical protein